MRGYRDKTEGIIHRYPKNEGRLHDTIHGTTGCHCEPEVIEHRYDEDGTIITRVILHQKLKKVASGRR
jgi:hypothetical protein